MQDRTTGGGTAVALSARYTADGERIEKSDPFTGTKVSSFGLFDTKTKGGAAEGTLHTPGISFRKGLDVSGGAVGTTGSDRFFHTDQLGSTRHLTDGTGTGTHSTTPSRMRFDAYGLPTQLEGADGWDATEYQYAGAWGYEREPNGSRLGLDYLYQRYYDPAVGKFLSPDPIGIAGGLNLYAYCENDPVNAVDPLGLRKTGTYGGDVLEVIKGYGDVLNPVNFVRGAGDVVAISRRGGPGAALGAVGQGIWHGYTNWLSTDDPRAFGQSFGTVLSTIAAAKLGAFVRANHHWGMRGMARVAVAEQARSWSLRPRRVWMRMVDADELQAIQANGGVPCGSHTAGPGVTRMFPPSSAKMLREYAGRDGTPHSYQHIILIRLRRSVRPIRGDSDGGNGYIAFYVRASDFRGKVRSITTWER